VAGVDPEAVAWGLGRVGHQRNARVVAGIQGYRNHQYRSDVADPPAIWREGTTTLRDYGAVEGARPGGPVVLCVPSLINRSYVLDLKADNSLLREMAAAGIRPLLVDWDWPGDVEKGFTLSDYIAGRLEGALDAAREVAGGPVGVLGYCMGGMLALALAQRRPRDTAALALLATPWDFHAEHGAQARLAARAGQGLEPAMQAMGQLPVDAIQMLFTGIDPHTAVRKFLAFGKLNPDSRRAEVFVALEDWLNDGVPLAAPVARECLYDWYGANTPARGGWRVAGRPVDPAQVAAPTLCLVPQRDRIVPPASARALGAALANAEVRTPPLGHIGMVVSARAREEVWSPLSAWLKMQVSRRA
jgi:polyhydroxyalkanoate synthase